MILTSTLSKILGYDVVRHKACEVNPSHMKQYVGENPIKDSTLVGIELEFENYTKNLPDGELRQVFQYNWINQTDGSLRNHGMEFITHIGFNASDCDAALGVMQAALTCPEYAKIDASARCGVHVHLNMLDETVGTCQKLILLYCIFEQFLFQYSGNRQQNLNCVPMLDVKEVEELSAFLDNPTKVSEGQFIHMIKSFDKYGAFNLHALLEHGTIEFRHHAGTKDMKVVRKWLRMLLEMLNYARVTPIEHLKTTLFELNTKSHYYQFFNQVFPCLAGEQGYEIRKDMRENVARLKEIILLHKQEKQETPKQTLNPRPRPIAERGFVWPNVPRGVRAEGAIAALQNAVENIRMRPNAPAFAIDPMIEQWAWEDAQNEEQLR